MKIAIYKQKTRYIDITSKLVYFKNDRDWREMDAVHQHLNEWCVGMPWHVRPEEVEYINNYFQNPLSPTKTELDLFEMLFDTKTKNDLIELLEELK